MTRDNAPNEAAGRSLSALFGWRPPALTPRGGALVALVLATLAGMLGLWFAGTHGGDVSYGWTETEPARVEAITPAPCPATFGAPPGGCRTIRGTLTSGDFTGRAVSAIGSTSATLRRGDVALVSRSSPRIVVGRDRGSALAVTLALACGALLLVGGLAGLRALLALAGIAVVAVLFAAPAIIGGRPVLAVGLVTGSATALLLSWTLRSRATTALATVAGSAVVALIVAVVGNATRPAGSSGELLPATDLRVSGLPVGGMLTVAATIGAVAVLALLAPRIAAAAERLHDTGNLRLRPAGVRTILRATRSINAAAIVAAGLLAATSAGPAYALLTLGGIGTAAVNAPALADPVIAGSAVALALAAAVLVLAVVALATPPAQAAERSRPDDLERELARLTPAQTDAPAPRRRPRGRKGSKRRGGRR